MDKQRFFLILLFELNIIPSFQHSIFLLGDLCVLCLLFGHPPVFIRKGYRERKISISQKEKRTTNRRDRGGRREGEIGIQSCPFFVFWKKTLCGLCVLCGSILFFIFGGRTDIYNFLCNEKKFEAPQKYGIE
jgi:hypothetical protein